jgi:hypothetical protein
MSPDTFLQPGDIVQLDPATCRTAAFRGCFMVVSEPKGFGAQGYITPIGEKLDTIPNGACYYRAKWEEMELTGGRAVWMFGHPGDGDEVAG